MLSQHLIPPQEIVEATDLFLTRRQAIAERFQQGESAMKSCLELSELTDQWILTLWETAIAQTMHEQCFLYALGGYGRRELSFYSDLDLLIEVRCDALYHSQEFCDGVERFMTWCRQARLKLSHTVRTPTQAQEAFEQDARSAVALVDARELQPGRTVPWYRFNAIEAIDYLRADNAGLEFVQLLANGRRERFKRHGQTVYLLEPDIKQGEGGLRDLHVLHWAARVRWGFCPLAELSPDQGWYHEQQQVLQNSFEFLFTLRHHLHLLHERKQDRLNFPDQEELARRVIVDTPDGSPPHDMKSRVETLMRQFYQVARDSSLLTERFLRRWSRSESEDAQPIGTRFERVHDQIALRETSCDHLLKPLEILEALDHASKHKTLLDPVLELAIVKSVESWTDQECNDVELNTRLVSLLTDLHTSGRSSQRLLELGMLTRLIPEFEPIVCHVQHDTYHVYTTDRHSLKCLERARRLLAVRPDSEAEKWPIFGAIAQEVIDTDTLLLASIFHDIGKNRGGDHSKIGAELVTSIGERFRLQPDQIDQLAFLVREHLTLSHTARRRDIADPRVIRDIAARLRTVETLNQLTVLTFCDMSTVAPNIMTDWHANLLTKLYQRLRAALEHGVESLWKTSQEQIHAQLNLVLQLWKQNLPDHDAPITGLMRSRLDEFIRDMPTEHFLSTTPESLLRQFEVYDRGRHAIDGLAISCIPLLDHGVTEIIVTTKDVPGTLAKICGVFSASNLNILAASIVTTASGRTLDIFKVNQSNSATALLSSSESIPLTKPHRIERLEKQLTEVLSDQLSVDELLIQRLNEHRLAPRPTPKVKTSVSVHQDVSDTFTVIEVRAPDQLGLLYQITRTFWHFGVSTHLSKIDSLGTQVVDIFYVEDIKGGKLDVNKTDALVEALYLAIESSPYTR